MRDQIKPLIDKHLVKDKQFYLSHEGRIGRDKFLFSWFLPVMTFFIVLYILDRFLTGGLLYMIAALALLWPSIVIGARRCHDRGKSGWWQLLSLIPVLGFVWYIVDLCVLKGTEGANAYGPDPKD